MAKDSCSRNTNLLECFSDQVGLGFWRPDGATRALAVTETRPVKYDDPISLSRFVNKAA